MKGFGIEIKNNLLDPKHVENMGVAVWLYMWFLDKITKIDDKGIGWVLGGKPIILKDTEKDLALSERTYNRWMADLRGHGYINTLRTPHGLVITVNKAFKRFGNKLKSDTPNVAGQVRQERQITRTNMADVNKDSNRDSNSKTEQNTGNSKKISRVKNNIELLVDYYFELKGWDDQPKEFYRDNGISYPRHLKAAKNLLELCEGNLGASKDKLNLIKDWAEGNGLEWAIETIFKKWLELDKLKV